jgi:ABC-type phosphate transport system substrate-binding protein
VPGNLPNKYINDGSQQNATGSSVTNGKLLVWRCAVPGFAGTTVFKYSATGSSDGIKKLTAAGETFNCSTAVNPALNNNCMTFLPDAPSNCVANGSNPKTRPSDGKQFNEFVCSDNEVFETINVGTSDVAGSSFGQQGPVTTTVNPLDQSSLISTQVAIVPFDIVVGNNVGRVVNGVLQPLENLSRTEVEALLSYQTTDWRQLGYNTGTIGTGTIDATSPTTLCMRKAGSGTKAALDQTVLKDAKETPLGTENLTSVSTRYFGQSNQDVRDCIGGNAGQGISAHPNAIGYMEADQAADLVAAGGGRIVRVNGYRANDPAGATVAEKKKDLRCGRHLYWVGERFNTRNPSSADASTANLISQYIANASSPGTIALVPAGNFWDSPASMFVSKNADPGPIAWKTGAHPACND